MCTQEINLTSAIFANRLSPKPESSLFTREFTKIKSFTSNKSKIDLLDRTKSKPKLKKPSCQETKICSLLFH